MVPLLSVALGHGGDKQGSKEEWRAVGLLFPATLLPPPNHNLVQQRADEPTENLCSASCVPTVLAMSLLHTGMQ